MRIELEYHGDEYRWYWRVIVKSELVREGSARSYSEAVDAAQRAAAEYNLRKIIQL